MENFWDYSVWGGINVVVVLLASLLVANILKNQIKWLKASLIPTSVLGGAIILLVAGIYKLITGDVMFDTEFFGGNGTNFLEIITYHALALGFIASGLKTSDKKLTKERATEVFNTGITTVATYLLQGIFGLGITIVAAYFIKDFFVAAGVLLPFGYGQGTGQAMNYGNIYETQFGFVGGKSFGLTIAALGFISASVGGVIHLIYLKKTGKLAAEQIALGSKISSDEIQSSDEIPMEGSMDKMTVQVALITVTYFVAYLLMLLLGALVPSMKSIIYGFNFLLGVIAATIVKAVLKFGKKTNIIKRDYTNNFLLTRTSNFFFDVMIVAGVAAIRLSILESYWGIILILGIVGLVITYIYERIVAKKLFKDYQEEQFLMMYGMLTGTASTGTILLREIDPRLETPASSNMVYQNIPAIVFGFPMMLLATLAPVKPILTLIILTAYFIVLNILLFRKQIFRKRK